VSTGSPLFNSTVQAGKPGGKDSSVLTDAMALHQLNVYGIVYRTRTKCPFLFDLLWKLFLFPFDGQIAY
jgi:hypothetical protein